MDILVSKVFVKNVWLSAVVNATIGVDVANASKASVLCYKRRLMTRSRANASGSTHVCEVHHTQVLRTSQVTPCRTLIRDDGCVAQGPGGLNQVHEDASKRNRGSAPPRAMSHPSLRRRSLAPRRNSDAPTGGLHRSAYWVGRLIERSKICPCADLMVIKQ